MSTTLIRWRSLAWVLPAMVLLLVFVYYPIVENLRLSLFSWNAFSVNPTFVGFDNYRTAFDDPIFWRALRNNTVFAIVSLVFQVGFALVLAALLEEFVHQRLRGILRTIYFIPAVISITVAGILFSFIYNPEIGLVNRLLAAVGLDSWQHSWLGEPGTAMGSIIAMSQWQSIGYTSILFVVAIQRIPKEFHEAAKGRRGGAGAPVLLRDRAHGARDDDAHHDPHDLGRVPRVQRGDGHDLRRTVQLQPGARHVALPQRLPQRRHGLRLRDRHGDLRDHPRARRCPDHRQPPTEDRMVMSASSPTREKPASPTTGTPRTAGQPGGRPVEDVASQASPRACWCGSVSGCSS